MLVTVGVAMIVGSICLALGARLGYKLRDDEVRPNTPRRDYR